MIAQVIAICNIMIFGSLGVLSLYDWWHCRRHNGDGWCWIKLAQAIIGLYWFGIYVFVAIVTPGSYNSVLFGQAFIRPAFMLTGAIMLSSAIIGARRRGIARRCDGCKNDR